MTGPRFALTLCLSFETPDPKENCQTEDSGKKQVYTGEMEEGCAQGSRRSGSCWIRSDRRKEKDRDKQEGEHERPEVNVSFFQGEIQSEELAGTGRLDFWCIGVLIPALNYPLSWAQLGPLVKTPPLFVLRSR